jgi:hypothetical protein
MHAWNPRFPVKVSRNGRYFVDQAGAPVFWLGTTQWELFRGYTQAEAREIIEGSSNAGFTFIQTKLLGGGDGTRPNTEGEKPFLNDDPLTPNEAYFRNVDALVKAAAGQSMIISFSIFHQSYKALFPLEKVRPWARWFAARYTGAPNIFWNMTPQANDEYVPIIRELASGIREADGRKHMITFKPDPSPFSSGFMHREKWLDFNSMQTWKDVQLIYPMIREDYVRRPAKPVVMAEGAYEAGTEYGFDVTPLWVRRQAWYTYLLGAHHGYGHNDAWRILPAWRQSLSAPAALQMGTLRRILEARAQWWLLVPDQSVLVEGGRTDGQVLTLGARHEKGKWILAYLAEPGSVSIAMKKLRPATVAASWIDPRSGTAAPVGIFPNRGVQTFTTPSGMEDALLVLEAEESGA